MKRLSPAAKAWIGLTAYVVAADGFLIYREVQGSQNYYTMSTAFETALRHPIKRWPVGLLWTLLTLHLFDVVFPDSWKQHDPLMKAAHRLSVLLTKYAVFPAEEEPLQYVS
jgi:hypothetical protein